MTLITARTDRITVKLKELNIRSLCRLAAMPADSEHQLTTVMLEECISAVESGPEDPRDWTVQERTYIKAQYMAATLETGPDFVVSASKESPSKLSDYLQGEKDYSGPMVEVGEYDGQTMCVRHLTGRLAESIERVAQMLEVGSLGAWELGMIAVMLIGHNDAAEPSTESLLDQWVITRVDRLLDMRSTEFIKVYQLWRTGFEKLQHLVCLQPSVNDGLVCIGTGGKAGSVPPARFPVDSILPRFAFRMAGKPAPSDA